MFSHILFWLSMGALVSSFALLIRLALRRLRAWKIRRLQERVAAIYRPRPAKTPPVVPRGFEESVNDPVCCSAHCVEPYLRHQLPLAEARRFWRHLLGCEDCLAKAIRLEALRQERGLSACSRTLEVATLYGESRKGAWVDGTLLHIETCLICQAYILWLFGQRRRDQEWVQLEQHVSASKKG